MGSIVKRTDEQNKEIRDAIRQLRKIPLQTQTRMPRPVRLEEPGWVWIDLDLKSSQWDLLIKVARAQRVPLNVFIRQVIDWYVDDIMNPEGITS